MHASATQRHTQTAFVERANLLIGKAISALQSKKEIEKNKTVKGWIDDVKTIIETINEQADNTKEKRDIQINKKNEENIMILKEAFNKKADDEVDELIDNIKDKIQPNIIKYDIPLGGQKCENFRYFTRGNKSKNRLRLSN